MIFYAGQSADAGSIAPVARGVPVYVNRYKETAMNLRGPFFAAMDREMEEAAYKRSGKGRYFRAETSQMRAHVWVYATTDRTSGTISITPNLGVYFPSVYEIERACLPVTGMEPSKFTLGLPVNYRGYSTHRPWNIADEADAEVAAAGIRDLYETVGREFLDEYSDLTAVLAAYRPHVEWDLSGHTAKTLAVACAAGSAAAEILLDEAQEAALRAEFPGADKLKAYIDCLRAHRTVKPPDPGAVRHG